MTAKKNKFTTTEAAHKLDISRQYFWRKAKEHSIRPIEEWGRTKLYSLQDIQRLDDILNA